ncbi:MAG: extracellular solute-binding protein [Proteobacteria bacterium]|nr:extracellular solute-binding protein [Pseudomonadota bacterium]
MMRISSLVAYTGFLCLLSSSLKAETLKLNFWEQSPPQTASEIDKWITVFQKANPEIQIIRQHYENEELRTKFLRSSVTGDGADIVYGPNDLAGVFATAGVIQAVDTMIKAEQFTAKSLELTRLSGKTWGVPSSEGNHLLLYFNKDLVKTPPADTKALIATAKAFTKPEQNQYGLAFFQSEPFWFASILAGFGAAPLAIHGQESSVTIDTAEMQRALQFLVDLKDKEKILPPECNYDCAKSMFLAGKALYHINGDWELSGFQEKFGAKLGSSA